jgi:hypothetical protein
MLTELIRADKSITPWESAANAKKSLSAANHPPKQSRSNVQNNTKGGVSIGDLPEMFLILAYGSV